jgi:hypothetical protein
MVYPIASTGGRPRVAATRSVLRVLVSGDGSGVVADQPLGRTDLAGLAQLPEQDREAPEHRMDDVARLIGIFQARSDASVASKLDALMDVERLNDPRIVQFLLGVMTDRRQPVEVRVQALKRVRDRQFVDRSRESAAATLLEVVRDSCAPPLRLHAALALAEFTDVAGVPAGLGAIARDPSAPLDIRYTTFTSLERTGPTPECVALLRQLLADDALGASARSLLLSWRIGQTP